jgi:hypothetical protein
VIGEIFTIASFLMVLLLHPEPVAGDTTIQTSSDEPQESMGVEPASTLSTLWMEAISAVKYCQAISLLLISFLGNLGYDSLNQKLLLPYISKRYHQNYSEVSFLLCV